MDPKSRKKSQEEIQQIPQRKGQRVAGIQQSLGGHNMYETYVECQKQQQRSDIIFIVMCLKLHFVFSFLNDAQLNHLASQMFYCKLLKGQSIIKQGDGANAFFILEKGKIQVQQDFMIHIILFYISQNQFKIKLTNTLQQQMERLKNN